MSLRYRLFLWVSGLFVAVAVSSFFLENYLTRYELRKAQASVREKILGLSENRRIDLQNFLAAAIAENEVRIDAVLNNLLSFSPQIMRFGPTAGNMKFGTWGDASDLLLDYKWIDFLQNTGEGKVTSAVVPRQKAIETTYKIDIDDQLSWIYQGDLKSHPEPYLAVRVPYTLVFHSTQEKGITELPEEISGAVPAGFLLFDLKELSYAVPPPDTKMLAPIPVGWSEGYVVQVEPFVKSFQRAQELAKENKLVVPEMTPEEVLSKMEGVTAQQGGKLNPIPAETLLASVSTEKAMKDRLEEIALRYTQVSMIWILTALYDSGIFGNDLFSYPSPKALALFTMGNAAGIAVKADDVFFQECLFDDGDYFQKNPPADDQIALGSSLAVIAPPGFDRVYLGNTAELVVRSQNGERTGFLTLGVDADTLLQRLVLAIHQTVVLVHGGRPLAVFGEEGLKLDTAEVSGFDFEKMLGGKSGLVPWQGTKYFYMQIQPFPQVDLHFIVLNPEEKEFALLRDLETGSKQVVDSMLFNIHIAGLIALLIAVFIVNNIARSITKPIIQLADATGYVVEGHYEKVQLKLPPLKHNDEIAVLCHSFVEMVKGLEEKEKVKGVLNKVVSREIAQEILNGTVHLGGEEKLVTVLFADIRGFTKMTQNMQPKDVIELLNTCMTKISAIIDKNGGVIDKYVGDEAMALFGAPIASEEAPFKAVQCSLEIIEVLKRWNAERKVQGLPEIEMGIGIHTGPMLVGNMGAENRLNYTVIGSNVNLAARLCGAAKRMEILITKDTLDACKDRIVCEQMPAMEFKGFDRPVEVYRVKVVK